MITEYALPFRDHLTGPGLTLRPKGVVFDVGDGGGVCYNMKYNI